MVIFAICIDCFKVGCSFYFVAFYFGDWTWTTVSCGNVLHIVATTPLNQNGKQPLKAAATGSTRVDSPSLSNSHADASNVTGKFWLKIFVLLYIVWMSLLASIDRVNKSWNCHKNSTQFNFWHQIICPKLSAT